MIQRKRLMLLFSFFIIACFCDEQTSSFSSTSFKDTPPENVFLEEMDFLFEEDAPTKDLKEDVATQSPDHEELTEITFVDEPLSKGLSQNQPLPTQLPSLEITPDAGPKVLGGKNLFLTADFIYWNIKEEGLDLGINRAWKDQENLINPNRVIKFNFKWEPGFKIGIGSMLNEDGWDIYAEYTWLRSENIHKRITTLPFTTLRVFDQDVKNITSWIDSAFQWDLRLNVIDFELGRNYFISRFLKLRPYIGLKTVVLYQSFNQRQITQANVMYRMQFLIDQWGLGICLGMDTAWQFNRYFSLFGNISLNGVRSYFKTSFFNFSPDSSGNTDMLNEAANGDNRFYKINPVIEWSLGLRAETWLQNEKYHFMVQAGWEEQIWISENQFLATFPMLLTPAVQRGGDLFFQGISIKARFDF